MVAVAVLLLVTYRSPVLWLLALLAVGLANRVAGALTGGLARQVGLPVDAAAGAILSVLVFGAATDYAPLLGRNPSCWAMVFYCGTAPRVRGRQAGLNGLAT